MVLKKIVETAYINFGHIIFKQQRTKKKQTPFRCVAAFDRQLSAAGLTVCRRKAQDDGDNKKVSFG